MIAMMRQRLGLLLFFLGICLGQAEVRLGILPAGREAREYADLLTAAFSSAGKVALVERAEIDRVFREQNLASLRQGDLARFGQLLHAQGVIFLQAMRAPEGPCLAVRLVAVQSGVVLDGALYPLPIRDASDWSKLLAQRFQTWLPKLEVSREQAVPISLVGLRSSVKTSWSVAVEQQLTALLFHRLMAERDLFVLERRKMSQLAWEKEWSGAAEAPFWNGAYLVDGVIDQDGASAETLTIHARLLPPGNRPPIALQISAERRKSREAIEKLAAGILQALQRQPTASAWSPEHEAQRFEDQASWAAKWETWSDAYAGADSAYALGRRTEEVVALKIRALLEPAHTPPLVQLYNHRGWIFNESKGGWVFDLARNFGWNEIKPAPYLIPHAREALEFYGSHCRTLEADAWRTNAAWLSLGVYALQTASDVLRHHYFFAWRQNKFDEGLPELRAAARSLYAQLQPLASPSATNLIMPYYHGELPMTLDRVAGLTGAFWQETPQETIKLYQQMMQTGAYDRARLGLFYYEPSMFMSQRKPRPWHYPFWIAWNPKDRDQGAALWQSFVASLAASTNLSWRADALLFKLHEAYLDPDIALAAEEFYDLVMDRERLRFRTEVNSSVLDSFGVILQDKGKLTLRRQRLQQDWQQHGFARLKHYLQTATTYDEHWGPSEVRQRTYLAEQAREILPVVEDYTRRFPNHGELQTALTHVQGFIGQPPDEFAQFFARDTHDPVKFAKLFENRTFAPAEAHRLLMQLNNYQSRVGLRDDIIAARSRLIGMGAVSNVLAIHPVQRASASPPLKPTQHFKAFAESESSSRPAESYFERVLEREGRLFAAVPLERSVMTDPLKFKYEEAGTIVEFNLAQGGYHAVATNAFCPVHRGVRFEIFQGAAFWIAGESHLVRSPLGGGAPQRYPVPVSLAYADLCAVGGRLFIFSREYLAEFFPQNGSTKLLASTRRNPPATKLDSWEWPSAPGLACGPGGSLLAEFAYKDPPASTNRTGTMTRITGPRAMFDRSRFGGPPKTPMPDLTAAWQEDAASGNWSQLPSTGERFEKYFHLAPGRAQEYQEFSVCFEPPGKRNPQMEILLADDVSLLPRWPAPFDLPYRPGLIAANAFNLLYNGTNLWTLRDAGALTNASLLLFGFEPRWEMPWRIPVALGVKRDSSPGQNRSYRLQPLPSGLVIVSHRAAPTSLRDQDMKEFWFISYRDTQAWIAAHCNPSRNLERREPALRHSFDTNQNGILDAVEMKPLQSDAAWREKDSDFNARRYLFTFDANGDNQLDKTEITDALVAKKSRDYLYSRMSSRYEIHSLSLDKVLADYDRNHDGVLDLDEVKSFYTAEIQPTYSSLQAASRALNPGGSPSLPESLRKYDLNGNGRLEPEERAKWREDRQKLENASGAPKRQQPSVPAPR